MLSPSSTLMPSRPESNESKTVYKPLVYYSGDTTPSSLFQNGMAQTRCHVSSVYVVFLLCLSWIFTLSDLLMFSVLSLFFLRIINNFSFLPCCHFWHIHQWWSYCNKCRGFNCHTSQRVTSLPYLAESGLSTIPR